MRRSIFIFLAAAAIFSVGAYTYSSLFQSPYRIEKFDPSIDALSVAGDVIDVDAQGYTGTEWTQWQHFEKDTEQDPSSTESNLVMFPRPVSVVRLRGKTLNVSLHPIRISQVPASYDLASTIPQSAPRILSRRDWGADESLLLQSTPASSSSSSSSLSHEEKGNGNETESQPSSRVQECEQAQKLYPAEFRIARTVTMDANGKLLRWPQQYSPAVRLLVVHHTAGTVGGDPRSSVERMRALYQYHAVNRGWGDIGYHYIIDETGQIYQGRAGGESVIAGHAYCNNTGSIGVALMGNFEIELPSQAQMQSLQWLLDTLSKQYDIDLTRNVLFHGKSLPPIVGHRDLLSTTCPGYYAYQTLNQVRSNVRSGNLSNLINFPPPPTPPPPVIPPRPATGGKSTGIAPGFSAVGSTTLNGRPGTDVALTLQYQTGAKPVRLQEFLGNVFRSPNSEGMGVWMAKGSDFVRVGDTLRSPVEIPANTAQIIRLKVRLPLARVTATLKISGVTYTLTSEGLRLKAPGGLTSTYQDYIPPPRPASSSSYRSISSVSSRSSSSFSYSISSSPSSSSLSSSSSFTLPSPLIRILLNDTGNAPANAATVIVPSATSVNGRGLTAGTISLQISGNSCLASQNGKEVATGIVRIDPRGGISTIGSWVKANNRFRGILECRVIDGHLAIINELSLEDYMAGLSEEPDSEPAAKQMAFAIAARSYAAYYRDPAHRKFPGQPYDGSDDPAIFQKYDGVAFEDRNPRWVSIVRATAGEVLKAGNDILKVPYFSSDDGRTRSPAEVGWTTFPHPEVFSSKPDPWCKGMENRGHGVGMSGCGAKGQAYEGKTAEQILQYYYPGATITKL